MAHAGGSGYLHRLHAVLGRLMRVLRRALPTRDHHEVARGRARSGTRALRRGVRARRRAEARVEQLARGAGAGRERFSMRCSRGDCRERGEGAATAGVAARGSLGSGGECTAAPGLAPGEGAGEGAGEPPPAGEPGAPSEDPSGAGAGRAGASDRATRMRHPPASRATTECPVCAHRGRACVRNTRGPASGHGAGFSGPSRPVRRTHGGAGGRARGAAGTRACAAAMPTIRRRRAQRSARAEGPLLPEARAASSTT